MKLDINNSSLNETIWVCLIEKFFYETRAFDLVFDSAFKFSVVGGAFSDGYLNMVKGDNNNFIYSFKFENNNSIWRDDLHLERLNNCSGCISLCMSYLECNFEKALETLKGRFLSRGNYKDKEKRYSVSRSSSFYPGENFVPVSIFYNNEIFHRVESYNYYSIKGNLLGVVIKYKSKQDYFELPFVIEEFSLSDMFNYQFVHLPDIDFTHYNCIFSVFDNHRKVILVCDDFILAEKLNFIIHDSKNLNFKNKFYALSLRYVANAYNDKIFKYFKNFEMIYIPSANKKSFLHYNSFIEKHSGLYDLKIYKSTVFMDDGSSVDLKFNDSDLFENYLMQHVDSDSSLDSIYIEKIYTEAISMDEFRKWSRIIGLLSVSSFNNQTDLVDLTDFMKSINFNATSSGKDYYWDNFFTPQNINLVVAPSHFGKTFFLLSITYFLSLGLGSFGFKVKNKYKVLYIDGESTDEYFGQMMNSLIAEASHIVARQSPSFHPHLFKQFKGDFDWDFSNEKFLDKVTEWISSGINLVVIDNLNSLAKRFVTSSAKWDFFIQWIVSIQKKYSTAFILAHHSNKNWETLGLESVEGKSHNVIQLYAGNSIIDKFKFASENDTESIKNKIMSDNFVMGINFKKCQSFLDLQDSKHVYYRDKTSLDFHNKWEKIYPDSRHVSNEVESNITNVKLDLSIRLLNYAKKNKKFRAIEAAKFFSVSRSKITLCINSLIGKGIEKYGDGRSTKYFYSFDD